MYGCESWTVKKAECQRIDAFELWCWRRLLRVPWTARRSNQSILKDDPTSVLGVLWKDLCWSWNSNTLATPCKVLTHWERPWCWEGLGAGGERDDRGWHGWMASPSGITWWMDDGWMVSLIYAHEFGWTPGVGDGQGGLACCDSWGCKESDPTEWLNWTELIIKALHYNTEKKKKKI